MMSLMESGTTSTDSPAKPKSNDDENASTPTAGAAPFDLGDTTLSGPMEFGDIGLGLGSGASDLRDELIPSASAGMPAPTYAPFSLFGKSTSDVTSGTTAGDAGEVGRASTSSGPPRSVAVEQADHIES